MSKAASTHSLSYYDWKLTFKRKDKVKSIEDDEVNSLGIPNDNFKDFLKKWKDKNFE